MLSDYVGSREELSASPDVSTVASIPLPRGSLSYRFLGPTSTGDRSLLPRRDRAAAWAILPPRKAASDPLLVENGESGSPHGERRVAE